LKEAREFARTTDCDDFDADAARQDAPAAVRDYDATMLWRWLALGCALAALVSVPARATTSTLEDCIEGADFIGNAAYSRDNGLARATFLDRLESDFVAIRAFPAALRWFVKDADDERFLRAAATDVFDRPQSPDRHRAAFFAACVTRATA
jgi:hypothetical protein